MIIVKENQAINISNVFRMAVEGTEIWFYSSPLNSPASCFSFKSNEDAKSHFEGILDGINNGTKVLHFM